MTQEEKARRYDEAIEIARQYYNDRAMPIGTNFKLERIFPELKEDEDERIRKEIIDFLELPHPQFVGKRDHEKWIAWLEKQGEQKPVWSEEDKRYLNIVSSVIRSPSVQGIYDYHKVNPTDVSGWLKSLKDRVQPKQEWSEEDERMLNDIIRCGEHHCYLDAGNIAWLKSIAPPYYCDNCKLKKSIQGWKPSEEQMDFLQLAIEDSKHNKEYSKQRILTELMEDLKKLTE